MLKKTKKLLGLLGLVHMEACGFATAAKFSTQQQLRISFLAH